MKKNEQHGGEYTVSGNTASVLDCKAMKDELLDKLYRTFQAIYGEEAGTSAVEGLTDSFDKIGDAIDSVLLDSISDRMTYEGRVI